MTKNRDGASLPSSNTRVKLQVVMEELGSDYINARFVYELCVVGVASV